ncbi:MAG: hypothetical protein AMXMBFR47_08850 [Planctomycetota bacterium]
MTIHIPLSSDAEARLREYAGAAGKPISAVIAEAIEEKLAIMEDESGERAGRPRSKEQWLKEFREWMDNHRPVSHFVDDSRESIYRGRDE